MGSEAALLTGSAIVDRSVLASPEPFYAALRAEAPVWRVPGLDLVLVAGHDLVVEACRRTDDFSNHLETLVATGDDGEPVLFDTSTLGDGTMTLATADPPEHTRHRGIVFPELVARRMATVRPVVDQFVIEHLAAARSDATIDWAASVANPIPARTIGNVIGLPAHDWPDIMRWAMGGTTLLAGVHTIEELAPFRAEAEAAGLYLVTKLIEAAEQPGDDLLGVLAEAVAAEDLSIEEAIGTLVILLGAGGESTASLIGNAARILAEDQQLQDRLRTDPSLIDPFIEEVVRLESPFKGHFRKVAQRCTLGGVDLQPGTTVLLLWAAANRDEQAFEDAGALRLDRDLPRSHLGFGRGVHHCVGAPLARMEATSTLEALLAATTTFSLDPTDPPRWEPSLFVRRHDRLPLRISWAS